jgi:hypothetical protein
MFKDDENDDGIIIVLFHCNLEINVDESCNNSGPPDQCKDPMSSCTEVVSGDYKCSCNPGYYNNGG